MRNTFTSLLAAAVMCFVTSCSNNAKTLVLYYSQSGTTKAVAEEIQKNLGADIEAIELANPYDGTYDETIARSVKERSEGVLPELMPLKSNLADYDVIFLGYPIWFGTHALPISALVASQDFAGKTVVPFCTFGSGGIDESTAALKAELPKANVKTGYGVRTARAEAMPAEVERFLKENKYMEGDVVALDDFSEPAPVTETEIKIFSAACGDYQFPLGEPVSFGRRKTPWGTEYKFEVKNGPATSVIYVISEDNAKPEFTKVVR